MTSTPPPDRSSHRLSSDYSRSASMPRQPDHSTSQWNTDDARAVKPRTPIYQPQPGHARHPSSSRPSLEGGRPRADFLEPIPRSNPAANRPRPSSTNLETLDFLRENEAAGRPPSRPAQSTSQAPSPILEPSVDEDARLPTSDIDFLRSMEDAEKTRSGKRASLSSLSGNKNILAGKFGDAFKRFESSSPSSSQRTPSPSKDIGRHELTPIAGSEATDGRSDDGRIHEDEDSMTPEMRREMERLQLLEEEQRVAAGQAEYRKRIAVGSSGPAVPPKNVSGASRAVSIQNRVQSLLSEEHRPAPVQRTASGYGKYTDDPEAGNKPIPGVPRKPLSIQKSRVEPPMQARGPAPIAGSSNASPALPPKPPKKPMHLNSIPTGGRPASPPKVDRPTASSERLVGVDLPGQPVLDMTAKEKDDYIQDFSKRFPSLGTIEMVEREITADNARSGR